MKKILILSGLVAVILTGCGENIKSESYYTKNPDEAAKVIEKCKLGEIKNANCTNAERANRAKVLNSILGR